MGKINHKKTIAELLEEKSSEERTNWLKKDVESFASSCRIEGLPINEARLLQTLKEKNHGV